MKTFDLHQGDCLEILKTLPDNSVDACVSDPPYGLSDHSPQDTIDCLRAWLAGEEYRPKKRGFMGRSWDAWVPGPEVWREVLRVLKPGGHLLAFAGTRSMDLMSMAVRLAGFELRDAVGYANDGGDPLQAPVLAWTYGSGFPKSMNVAKAIESGGGRPEDIRRMQMGDGYEPSGRGRVNYDHGAGSAMDAGAASWEPATDAARQWDGWGTALKPAWEPIILARKPLIGTVAQNVLAYGTGALNIDGCRVTTDDNLNGGAYAKEGGRTESNSLHAGSGMNQAGKTTGKDFEQPTGRFPANLIHDCSDEVVAQFPDSAGSGGSVPNVKVTGYGGGIGTGESAYLGGERTKVDSGSGSAARFFYCAKASRKDRNEGLTSSDEPAVQNGATMREREDADWSARNGNHHPTVKPTDLMAYLVRLVTPPGGVVLDPFLGSGSTGKAAIREGFRFIGCELSEEYLAIARARIEFEVAKIEAAAATAAAAAPVQHDLFAVA